MNQTKKLLSHQIEPYKSVLYFLCLLFFFHFSWKLSIDGDITDKYVYLFGKNVTPDWLFTACRWLTVAVAWFVKLFPNTDSLIVNDYSLGFPEGGITIGIIWGCTGIKQMFIFCGIMVLYRCIRIREMSYSKKEHTFRASIHFPTYNRNKWWYIPMGCVILTVYNVIRIGSITLLTRGHADRFEDLHDGIFRYIYYGIIFLLWMIWEETYVKKYLNHERENQITA